MINQIITAKMMTMDSEKYHHLIVTTEEADWFRERIKNKELKLNYHLHLTGKCSPGSVGQFTENGFVLSCRHFAVTYTISTEVTVNKNWHTLRHISQRNGITARIMGIISRLQHEFLLSHDPTTLRRLPYQVIVDEFKGRFPERYMDLSVVSRVLRNTPVMVNGNRTSITELLPSPSALVGAKIVKLLETTNSLLSDRQLAEELVNTFNLQISRRYVSYCRNLVGIPTARLYRKKDSIFFSLGLVAQNLFVLKQWVSSRRPQVSTSSA